MVRLFVAVLLDVPTRAALSRVPRVEAPRGVKVRWVDERNLHLTLKFLGEMEESRIPAVLDRLRDATRGVSPFDLSVRALGAFPLRGPPRTLWAGCDGGAPLAELARSVDQALSDIGCERERRPFAAHVTLARVRGRTRQPLLPDRAGDQVFGTVRVGSISLMRSTLTPTGAVYEEIEEIRL